MATLDDVRGAIYDALNAGLTGIGFKPEHPPEQLKLPALVTYVAGGVWTNDTSEGKRVLARVVIELHVARAQGQQRAFEELSPYLDTIPNLLMKARRDGAFSQHFTFGAIDFEILMGNWAAIETVMARFTVNDVKVRNTIA